MSDPSPVLTAEPGFRTRRAYCVEIYLCLEYTIEERQCPVPDEGLRQVLNDIGETFEGHTDVEASGAWRPKGKAERPPERTRIIRIVVPRDNQQLQFFREHGEGWRRSLLQEKFMLTVAGIWEWCWGED